MFKKTSNGAVGGVSVIGEGLTIEGNLQTDENVRVDGNVKGSEHKVGSLSVGKTGVLTGNIKTGEGVIAGKVHGNIYASGKLEILQGAVVYGEIKAHSMLVHEGSVVQGQVSVGEEKRQAAPARASECAVPKLGVVGAR